MLLYSNHLKGVVNTAVEMHHDTYQEVKPPELNIYPWCQNEEKNETLFSNLTILTKIIQMYLD